jgi:two-component system, LuxR family, response regulator FixJ
MVNGDNQCIFLVDDDPNVLETICETLEQICSKVSCFTNAAECLEQLGTERCNLLITDLKMPGMDGIELLTRVKRLAPWMPVLVVTGYGDIPKAVTAIQAGAAGFIEKPLVRELFLRKVQSLLCKDAVINSSLIGKALAEMERKVLELVVEGKTSKEIAHLLHRSTRTIEWHRNHIMCKLGVDNIADLMKQAVAMGMVKLQQQCDCSKTALNDELQEEG